MSSCTPCDPRACNWIACAERDAAELARYLEELPPAGALVARILPQHLLPPPSSSARRARSEQLRPGITPGITFALLEER